MINPLQSRHQRRTLVLGTGALLLLGAPFVKAQLEARDIKDALTVEALTPLVGGATTVTLQGKDIPLKTAVTQLMKAAQFPTEGVLVGETTGTVTVNWNQTPFWEAARDLEQQTGLQWVTLSFGGENTPLHLANKRNFSPPQGGLVGLNGAKTPLVMVVANKVVREAKRSLNLGQPANADDAPDTVTTSVRMTAYFDPRLRLSSASPRMEVTTPRGVQAGTYHYVPAVSVGGKSVTISNFDMLVETQGDQTKIPLITGFLSGDVVLKSEAWELPNITVNTTATREADGTTYKLEDVTLDGDRLTVKVARSSTREQKIYSQDAPTLRVLDGQGAEVPTNGSSSSLNTTNGGVSYKGQLYYSLRIKSKDFPEGEVRPGPFKLVWDIPTETKTLKVPFEFRDVPLP